MRMIRTLKAWRNSYELDPKNKFVATELLGVAH